MVPLSLSLLVTPSVDRYVYGKLQPSVTMITKVIPNVQNDTTAIVSSTELEEREI